MQQVSGKVAFITGGASGIGFGMARAFLAAGMRVVLADRSSAHLQDAARQLGAQAQQCELIELEVTDRAAMASAAAATLRRFGKVHVLCNNAGIGISPGVMQASHADWDHMMNINLGGVINGVVAFLPLLNAHGEGGHIVNTASMAGLIPLPDPGVIYSTSKFAVRGLSESLRLALAPQGIGVSLLCPGLTRTRILDEAREAASRSGTDALSAGFFEAQRHAMDPQVVGEAVLDAIRRNDAYVLTHAEFIGELASLHEELIACFRRDLPMPAERAAFEDGRRRSIQALKASMKRS